MRALVQGDRVVGTVLALAVAAVLAAGVAGWAWWRAAHDEGLAAARERDDVLAAVSRGLEVLNTLDHQHAERDVDRWLAVTAGRLYDELSGDRRLQLDRAAGTRAVSTAAVLRAAVTELDRAAGTARLVAVLDVRMATGGEPPEPRRSRLTVEASRTDQGWKVSSVQAAG
ncbi:Mce-associated membrane protein [Amycolatopsis arida]|uniref:Mce-associated membrane protein n=1 Tax=Amycolatopsis arida TaxID=587909 RepID=A0A1I5XKK8_9PSEU|nr:hypothetical protein [Amycolatopsis arida]TDX97386.1 Mce-associated membrane protein [Amycolatopsis arida]SFQ32512.1 Mce-associated membrane protein [Amycolatopsis arida]